MKLGSLRRRLLKQRKFRQLLISLLGISMVLGVLIVPLEKERGNIQTIPDGIWWATTTITTVGYGDYVPVTPQGRLIGIMLQVVGAVMFGLLIAIVGTSMNRWQEEFYWNRAFDRFGELEEELQALSKKVDYLVKDHSHEKDTKNLASALQDTDEPEPPNTMTQFG